MQELFKAAVERGASDIHIKAGDFMRARIHGELQPLTQQKLTVDQVKGIALQLIPHQDDRDSFDKLLEMGKGEPLPMSWNKISSHAPCMSSKEAGLSR